MDDFSNGHKNGCFMQTSMWKNVKDKWGFDAVVSKDDQGKIKGAAVVLNRRMPIVPISVLYVPRGPVCDYDDEKTLLELKEGIDELAKKYKSCELKCDPDVLMSDENFIKLAKKMGFSHNYGPGGFEGVQARFNYRLYLNGRTEDELFMNLSQPCRRKIRIAMKNGVEIRVCSKNMLPDFYKLMEVTGKRDDFNIRPISYFERFLDSLNEHARLYMGFYNGQPVCGAISVNFAGKVCYVYGASDNNHRDVMPNYLMQWEMIKWAVETKCSIYDFQGVSGNLSPDNNPVFGLYQFKKSFNGQLDELAGEFNFVYSKRDKWLLETGIELNRILRKFKRRLKGSKKRA